MTERCGEPVQSGLDRHFTAGCTAGAWGQIYCPRDALVGGRGQDHATAAHQVDHIKVSELGGAITPVADQSFSHQGELDVSKLRQLVKIRQKNNNG